MNASERVAGRRGVSWLRGRSRAPLGSWPTPVESVTVPGLPAIWVKRDDRSGWGRGGAKARKISFLMGHMLAHGYTDLVTVAGNVTNLAFDLVPAFDRAGLGSHLHIIDDPKLCEEDRRTIFDGLQGRVRLLGPSRREAFFATWATWAGLTARGRRPIWVLPGVSHPASILGNACGFLEMVEQLAETRRPVPATVFVTAATGTTLAGFLLAERALRESGHPPIRIVGVQIYPGRVRASIRWLARWTSWFSAGRLRDDFRIEVTDSALSGGFGRFPPELGTLCERVASECGLFIDPIFGGKTWSVMERHLERERPRDLSVLYWHCGYTPEWSLLGDMVRSEPPV